LSEKRGGGYFKRKKEEKKRAEGGKIPLCETSTLLECNGKSAWGDVDSRGGKT